MAENVFDLSVNLNEKIAVNPRIVLYKKPIRNNNYKTESSDDESPQEIRRQRLLEEQKKWVENLKLSNIILVLENPIKKTFNTPRKRDATFNAGRGLMDEALHSDDRNDEVMEVQQNDSWKRIKKFQCYANQFMMSEWMLEVPPDLLDKWLMVPCPQGQRTLLIACKVLDRLTKKQTEPQRLINSCNRHDTGCDEGLQQARSQTWKIQFGSTWRHLSRLQEQLYDFRLHMGEGNEDLLHPGCIGLV